MVKPVGKSQTHVAPSENGPSREMLATADASGDAGAAAVQNAKRMLVAAKGPELKGRVRRERESTPSSKFAQKILHIQHSRGR